MIKPRVFPIIPMLAICVAALLFSALMNESVFVILAIPGIIVMSLVTPNEWWEIG